MDLTVDIQCGNMSTKDDSTFFRGGLASRTEESESSFFCVRIMWTFGGNRANRRPISSKDVTAYGPMG
jgi:hypothetical protein